MDIHFIRENSHIAKLNQKNRFNDPTIIDEILKYDEEWKKIHHKIKLLNQIKNKISTYFKNAPKDQLLELNNLDETCLDDINLQNLTRDQLKIVSKYISEKIASIEKECDEKLTHRDNLINNLGNILHPDVPIDDNEDNNKIIYVKPLPDDMSTYKYDHIELGKRLGIIDTDSGISMSGNRGYFLTGMGVKLNLALLNYGIDFLANKEYKLMATPHILNKNIMSKITQLSEYEETLYKLDGYDKFLIATSEQPLTAYFTDKLIPNKQLPQKFAGLSNCFRKEAGAHGKQTRGIFRVHEFQKVEQFSVTQPDKSTEMFHSMINTSKEFYDSLGINYRIISIVSGALNNSASIKYDLEAYFYGSKFYGELVSCTNCLSYFSRRINTKIQLDDDYVYAHMLNCTLFANTRLICCLMETYQEENGMRVPEILQKYMECEFIPFIDN